MIRRSTLSHCAADYDAMPESDSDSVIPAQLSFLAIYNPTLGPTDETLEDQIVFYTSRADLRREDDSATNESGGKLEGNDKNARLRQIGLAQGMVNFARWDMFASPADGQC